MEVRALLTCTHPSVVTKRFSSVGISFCSRLLGARRLPLQRGASSRIPLDERAFVWGRCRGAQAAGLGLFAPSGNLSSRKSVQKDECSSWDLQILAQEGTPVERFMGELPEVQRGVGRHWM